MIQNVGINSTSNLSTNRERMARGQGSPQGMHDGAPGPGFPLFPGPSLPYVASACRFTRTHPAGRQHDSPTSRSVAHPSANSMQLCRVTGTIVSSRKAPSFKDGKLLIVHPIDTLGDLEGEMDMLAIDPGYGAGVDDVVIVAKEGAVVRQLMRKEDVPANVIILGVVDDWSAEA
jgi:microcompartment protein CcmK/EutM